MKQLDVDLENCYGIRRLQYKFDFSTTSAYAIYAPNGAMKSSLASTFQDIATGSESRDRIFPERVPKMGIADENGAALPAESVFVVMPYNERLSHSEKTSTLLVNAALRAQYEQLHSDVDKTTADVVKALKTQSGSKRDWGKEVSQIFTRNDHRFRQASLAISGEVFAETDAPFKDVLYDVVFNEKVVEFLGMEDFRTAIDSYIRKYNELLAASTYFRKGTFNYHNAGAVAKSLATNGFFGAKHSISLNAGERLEIASAKELDDLVAAEKEKISDDKDLRKKFEEIGKLISKNEAVRDFDAYLAAHEEILPELADIEAFRKKVVVSYLRGSIDSFSALVGALNAAEKGKTEIEAQAAKESTQWEAAIDLFNQRFSVPFKVQAINRTSMVLGREKMLSLGFTFEDGAEAASIDKAALMAVLSTGDGKAVVDLIHEQAVLCLAAPAGINFENKVVLSIAIRLAVEKFMVEKIADPEFMKTIDYNQTPALMRKYQELFPVEKASLDSIRLVMLMTPENIHLNSFMYDTQYWQFRHPTIRDAFASIVGGDPEQINIYISGAPKDRILAEVSCGNMGIEGAKVIIPPAIFGRVLKTIAGDDPCSNLKDDGVASFLAKKCTVDFLRLYFENPALIEMLPDRISTPYRFDSALTLLIRLHGAGILPNEVRLKAVEKLLRLAETMYWRGFVNGELVDKLVTEDENALLLARQKDVVYSNQHEIIDEVEGTWDESDDADDAMHDIKLLVETFIEENDSKYGGEGYVDAEQKQGEKFLKAIEERVSAMKRRQPESATYEALETEKAVTTDLISARSIFDDIDD